MTDVTAHAAIDLGATSGRLIVGAYDGERLDLDEVHRFPNAFQRLAGHDYWNIGGLFEEAAAGLRKARRRFGNLTSVGVNTWGVDYALVDGRGRLAFPVHAYRDGRTAKLLQEWSAPEKAAWLYERTGLPPIAFNSAFQLAESLQRFPGLKDDVHRVLFLPDYFNFLLSGTMGNEVSIASTTQLLGLEAEAAFHPEVLEAFGIPAKWFEPPQAAGRTLGAVTGVEGCRGVQNVLVPGHDTACAFEAMPRAEKGGDLLLSAGTWILAGMARERPLTGAEALRLKISNERCGDGTFRPLRNLMGLWLLEQLLPQFEVRPSTSDEWFSFVAAAESRPAPKALLDVQDESLFNPPDMRATIDRLVQKSGGKAPTDLPGYARLILDSLAEGVATAAREVEEIAGEPFKRAIIVGGGSRNHLLCQRIADRLALPLFSYQLEGTAVGNLAYQLAATGRVESVAAFRQALAPQWNGQEYAPRATA